MGIVILEEKKYVIEKAKLMLWLQLSLVHDKITSAVETKNFDELSSNILSYVSTALGVIDIDDLPWEQVVDALVEIVNINALTFTIPLLLSKSDKDEDVPWEYPGRNWYFWSHQLAKEFGWSLEYIANLEVEDAIKLLQEILVTKQLEREWEWSMSEKSVSYDVAIKKSRFVELPRPDWMSISVAPVSKKEVQIPEFMMPIGHIIRAKH